MKFKYSLFLLLIFILASCQNENYISGEVTFNPEETEETIVETEINLAAGKFYTVNVPPYPALQDQYPVEPWSTGSKLTDEETGSAADKGLFVGWEAEAVEVVIDLGSLRVINKVSIHAIADRLYNIKLPSHVRLAYSNDKVTWTIEPQTTTFTSETEPPEDVWTSIEMEKVKCRYVKIILESPDAQAKIAIDEIKIAGENINDSKYVPKDGAYHGAFTPISAYPVEDREGVTGNAVTLFEKMVEKQLSVMLWYQGMEPGRNFAEMRKAREDFWGRDYNGKYRFFLYGWLAQTKAEPIAQGSLDEYFKSYFTEVKEAQEDEDMEPIWFRPMNEMNGSWTPYYGDTKNFVRAWRRMYNIAEQLGITEYNVFVWSSNAFSSPNTTDNQMIKYYPGDIYVDWLGVSLYPPSLSTTFPENTRYPLTLMKEIHTISPDKPIMVSEGGYSGTCDHQRWVREWFELKTAYPRVKAVVWENHDGDPSSNGLYDRRLQSDPAAVELYKELVKDSYWLDIIPEEIYQEIERRR